MSSSVRARIAVLVFALAASAACTKEEEVPRLPLGHPDIGATGAGSGATALSMGPEARAALDSGNRLYSAKMYTEALGLYRQAAALEPDEQAPLFGMLMVATARGDSALADSIKAAMRARPGAGDSLLDVHTRPPANPHPPQATKGS